MSRKISRSAVSFIVGLVASSKASHQFKTNTLTSNSFLLPVQRCFALRRDKIERVKDVDAAEQMKLGEAEYNKAHYSKAKEFISKAINYSYVPPGSRPPEADLFVNQFDSNDPGSQEFLYKAFDMKSICNMKLNIPSLALADALACLNVKPNTHESLFRVGSTLMQFAVEPESNLCRLILCYWKAAHAHDPKNIVYTVCLKRAEDICKHMKIDPTTVGELVTRDGGLDAFKERTKEGKIIEYSVPFVLPLYQRRVNDEAACEYLSTLTHGVPVKVIKVQGVAGLGLVATSNIEKGALVLRETPFLSTVPDDLKLMESLNIPAFVIMIMKLAESANTSNIWRLIPYEMPPIKYLSGMARVYESFSTLWRLYFIFREKLKLPWNTSFDFEWFQSMASLFAINSYDITGKKQIVRLGAISSTINHSCDSNLIALHEGNIENNVLTFVARTDIKKGEQLFVSYVDPQLSKKERHEGLTIYGFTCNCSKCKAESSPEELNQQSEKKEENLQAELTNHQTPLSQQPI